MYQLIFHEEANNDFTEAYAWYELQQTGIGDEFRVAVDTALNKIKNNPHFFGYSKKPFREISLYKFPYTIVFKINARNNMVFISAVYHSSRNPKKKYRK